MERKTGTVVRGLRAPIIREGDDLASIVVNLLLDAQDAGEFAIGDRDIVAVTEAVVARSQGNYATTDQLAEDVRSKFGPGPVGLVFPILSRNRFAVQLRGIARGTDHVVLLLSYPGDEVGNPLVDQDLLDARNVDPYRDVLTEEAFEALFGKSRHPFTAMDYVAYYKELITGEGAQATVIFANDPRAILDYTDQVLACDIHTRARTKRRLREAGCRLVLGLDDLLTSPVSGSGCNPEFGILGSNKATEERIKLFPTGCADFAASLQRRILAATGKTVEALVYGDGAFKDPVGGIWELADPVVSPGFTPGLLGTPSEVKLKYLADNEFAHLHGVELHEAVSEYIRNKDQDLEGKMISQGTTPRRLTDLIGSLCDLTSGSGDKGTPVVYIQGYFDNFTKQ